jgi:hypothetical protein
LDETDGADPSFEASQPMPDQTGSRRLTLLGNGRGDSLEVGMRLLARLSYANVAATLALFFSLTGSAVAGAVLITGADVKDHSLTGADIKNGSLGLRTLSADARAQLRGRLGPRGAPGLQGAKGDAGPAGPAGANGQQGPAGTGITTTSSTGTDVADYQDLTPLATVTLGQAGDYVVFASLTVHNTGAANEYLNCGFRFNGVVSGAAGVETTAGSTTSGVSAGVVSVDSPGDVEFLCAGSGSTTYDISQIRMRAHYLG